MYHLDPRRQMRGTCVALRANVRRWRDAGRLHNDRFRSSFCVSLGDSTVQGDEKQQITYIGAVSGLNQGVSEYGMVVNFGCGNLCGGLVCSVVAGKGSWFKIALNG